MFNLVYRIGADSTPVGGETHGRLYESHRFLYLPIPEKDQTALAPRFETHPIADRLPPNLRRKKMHLDPDFEQLSYGNMYVRSNGHVNPKGTILLDLADRCPVRLVFLAGLRDRQGNLHYGFIGQIVARTIDKIQNLPPSERHRSVHGLRRGGRSDRCSAVALADPGDERSGRYCRFVEVAGWRRNSYRIHEELLSRWGGWSARDGYCQQGGPWWPGDHEAFEGWLQGVLSQPDFHLLRSNWPERNKDVPPGCS